MTARQTPRWAHSLLRVCLQRTRCCSASSSSSPRSETRCPRQPRVRTVLLQPSRQKQTDIIAPFCLPAHGLAYLPACASAFIPGLLSRNNTAAVSKVVRRIVLIGLGVGGCNAALAGLIPFTVPHFFTTSTAIARQMQVGGSGISCTRAHKEAGS